MSTAPVSLPARTDTLLGVCEAIGEDFGFDALWLRIVLATLLLWHPVAVIAAYGALGVVVAVSRWLLPGGARTPAQAPVAPAANNDRAAPSLMAA